MQADAFVAILCQASNSQTISNDGLNVFEISYHHNVTTSNPSLVDCCLGLFSSLPDAMLRAERAHRTDPPFAYFCGGAVAASAVN